MMFHSLIFTNLGESITLFNSISLKRLLWLLLSSSSKNCTKLQLVHRDFDNMLQNIPIDLQRLILKDFTIRDFIRLGAVNMYWRSAVKDLKLSARPGQFPWLTLPSTSNSKDISFFDLTEGSIYKFDLPSQLFGGRFVATSKGWLIIAKGSYILNKRRIIRLHLFNPISNEVYKLPGLVCYSSHDNKGDLKIFICKIELSSSNISECVVGGIFGKFDEVLGFCRPGDTKWITYQRVNKDSFLDLLYMNGAFNTLTNTSKIYSIQIYLYLYGRIKLRLIPSYLEEESPLHDFRLVESIDGRMLMILETREVITIRDDDAHDGISFLKKKKLEVFVIDLNSGCRQRLESIGDQAIFIGRYCSGCICLSNHGGPRNCIYFLDGNDCFGNLDIVNEFFGTREHGVFDIANGRIKRFIPCLNFPNESLMGWFTPTIMQ